MLPQAAEHIAALKSHPFYLLHVHLKQGYDLAAKDANGLSDPYVKFFLRGTNKAAHKSKTVYKDLNPVWDERFVIPVEDPFVPIDVKVGGQRYNQPPNEYREKILVGFSVLF